MKKVCKRGSPDCSASMLPILMPSMHKTCHDQTASIVNSNFSGLAVLILKSLLDKLVPLDKTQKLNVLVFAVALDDLRSSGLGLSLLILSRMVMKQRLFVVFIDIIRVTLFELFRRTEAACCSFSESTCF